MSDPLILIVEGAGMGGLIHGAAKAIGGRITEEACNYGRKWIEARYKDHAPEVVAKALENANAFLNRLGQKVAALEEESEITKSLVTTVMGEPSYSVLLQKAVLASAQITDPKKRDILVEVIRQHLSSPTDSLFTVTSPMAIDAIAHCTSTQLRIIAFKASLSITNADKDWIPDSEQVYLSSCAVGLNLRLAPYENLRVGSLDFAHLEAVSCATFVGAVVSESDLDQLLKHEWKRGNFTIGTDFLYKQPVGNFVRHLWEHHRIRSLGLTTVGRMIGTIVSDQLCESTPTSFADWQKPDVEYANPPADRFLLGMQL